MIQDFLLRLVTRDAEALVSFVERLRDKLNALLIAHAAELGKLQSFIEETEHSGRLAIEKVKSDVATEIGHIKSAVAVVETKIASVTALAEALHFGK